VSRSQPTEWDGGLTPQDGLVSVMMHDRLFDHRPGIQAALIHAAAQAG
jgi:hypothetical protein